MGGMKIVDVQFFRAVSPISRPIADATHAIPEIAFLITRIRAESGHVGESYLLCFHYSPQAIVGALKDAGEMALGWDCTRTEEFRTHFESESEYFGNPGINRWGLGSLEIAMWDIRARVLNKPVWGLFDRRRDRVPVYGSGGWLSYTIEELLDEVGGYVKRGFPAVKIKVGSPSLETDVERLTRVREAVGPAVRIMMDANQGMNLVSAAVLAARVRGLQITWFEEPLPNTDFDGYKVLRQEAGIQLAMGEREFNMTALRELAARDALDLWQPDILRLGGVQGWLDSARFANEGGIPVLPHYYKEYDVPLCMGIADAYGCESFDWVDGLIDHPIRIENGFAYPNPDPGWGFRFLDAHLTPIG